MNNQAAQPMPERTYMTRDEALKIARACAYAKCHTHDYLPRTAQEAADWQPHEWVLDAIRWNALSQPAGVPEWFADVKRCLQDIAEEFGHTGRGNRRFVELLDRMSFTAAPAASGGETDHD